MMMKNDNYSSAFFVFFKYVIIFWFSINFVIFINMRFFTLLKVKFPTLPPQAIFVTTILLALFFTLVPNIGKNTIFLNRGEKYVALKVALNSFMKISLARKCAYLFSLLLITIFLESMSSIVSMYINTLFGKNISIFAYALFLFFIPFYLIFLFKAETFRNMLIGENEVRIDE